MESAEKVRAFANHRSFQRAAAVRERFASAAQVSILNVDRHLCKLFLQLDQRAVLIRTVSTIVMWEISLSAN